MLRLQKIGKTRWWSKDVALIHVFDPLATPAQDKRRYIIVIKALLEIINSQKFNANTRMEAQSLANNLLKFETILTAYVFQFLFSLSATASAYLQPLKLNYIHVFSLLHSFKNNLIRDLNNFESIFNKATEFSEFIKQF